MTKDKILIIDDEANFCNLVKKNLDRTGEFEVHIATNGSDGLQRARELKPDLILLDIVMPEMDGGDVAALIKGEEEIKNTPIVFLTAIVKEEEADSQDIAKGYSLLAKTVSAGELINFIKDALKRKI